LKIVYKYVIKEYLKILFYSLFTFTAIYFIVDFFERLDRFIKYKTETTLIIKYLLFKTPLIIYQTLPIAVLLSTLMTIGALSKNNEITAMKSGGISIYKISMPLIFIALIITVITFITSEYVNPYTNQRVTSIMNFVKQKKTVTFLKLDNIWFSGNELVYNIDYFDSKTNNLHGVKIFNFDKDYNLTGRIDAKEGVYENKKWVLKDVEVRTFKYEGNVAEVAELKGYLTKEVDVIEPPTALKEARKKTDDMSYSELSQFVKKVKRGGYEATEYEVDMYSKFSIPFVSVIMTIIGIPFALKSERSGSIAVGVGISLIIGFCYFLVFSFAISLGHAGVIPPLISAWIALFIFLLIGAYMFSTIRQ